MWSNIILFFHLILNYSMVLSFTFLHKRYTQHHGIQRYRPLYVIEETSYPSSPVRNYTDTDYVSTILLKISYDGRHFTGWSSANDQYHSTRCQINDTSDDTTTTTNDVDTRNVLESTTTGTVYKIPQRRSRRYRNLPTDEMMMLITNPKDSNVRVRSVQGTIQRVLAKLYGNVSIQQIIVEGCSRTDKGVHATCMVAQIYCLSSTFDRNTTVSVSSSIIGKRVPHPYHSYDIDHTVYKSLLKSNVNNMIVSLNRMLLPDIQVMAYAYIPPIYIDHGSTISTLTSLSSSPTTICINNTNVLKSTQQQIIPFHPTLHAHRKTYTYTISIGSMYDPTQYRTIWHIGDGGCNTCSTTTRSWNITRVQEACHIMIGTHDFIAFQGAARGKSDQMKRQSNNYNTICTIDTIDIIPRSSSNNNIPTYDTFATIYDITIVGNRFLYKMIRMMIGTLVAVGKGKLSIDDVHYMIHHKYPTSMNNTTSIEPTTLEANTTDTVASRNNVEYKKNKEFECAPPHALVLRNVEYTTPFDWIQATM